MHWAVEVTVLYISLTDMWLAVLLLLALVAARQQRTTRSSQSSSRWLQCVQVPHMVCQGGRLASLFIVGLSLNVDFRCEDGIDDPREDPPSHPSSPPVASPAAASPTASPPPACRPTTPELRWGSQQMQTWSGGIKSSQAVTSPGPATSNPAQRCTGGTQVVQLRQCCQEIEAGRGREGGRRWWGRRVVMWQMAFTSVNFIHLGAMSAKTTVV